MTAHDFAVMLREERAAELESLREQITELPHATACQRGAICWCPISDVLELVDDRLLMLGEDQ